MKALMLYIVTIMFELLLRSRYVVNIHEFEKGKRTSFLQKILKDIHLLKIAM